LALAYARYFAAARFARAKLRKREQTAEPLRDFVRPIVRKCKACDSESPSGSDASPEISYIYRDKSGTAYPSQQFGNRIVLNDRPRSQLSNVGHLSAIPALHGRLQSIAQELFVQNNPEVRDRLEL